MIAAHHLQWPIGRPRTDYFKRKHGNFGTKERRPGGSWVTLNGPGSWDANPWGRVIEFKRIQEEGK